MKAMKTNKQYKIKQKRKKCYDQKAYYESYNFEPHCMAQGLTVGVKGLQVRTTLYDSRFDSGSERVAS